VKTKRKKRRPKILTLPARELEQAELTPAEEEEQLLEAHSLGRAIHGLPGDTPPITPLVRQWEIAIAGGFRAQNATGIPPRIHDQYEYWRDGTSPSRPRPHANVIKALARTYRIKVVPQEEPNAL
jgi:hypothetical protein